jgi:hypothetical protein
MLLAQASQVQMAAEENVNRPSFMVASTVTVKCYGQLGTSYPSGNYFRPHLPFKYMVRWFVTWPYAVAPN